MSRASQSFCLFLDPDIETDLTVQAAEGGLRFVELPGRERFVYQAGKLSRGEIGDSSVQLETIRHNPHNSLLMWAGPQARVTVNGACTARFTALNPGDVLDIDGQTLHVSLLNRPYIGPPDKSHLEAKCGYCRVRIQNDAEMRVYVCPNCRLPTHDHGQEIPVEKRLECVKLSSHCGHCQAEIVESEGFTHVPSL